MEVVLKFDSLSELAAYSKLISNRGYKISVRHLTLECKLNQTELEIALKDFKAKLSETKIEV